MRSNPYLISSIKSFVLAFAISSLLISGCREKQNSGARPERANKTLFFDDIWKRADAPGFQLENLVNPDVLPRGHHYWSGTYDESGRIVIWKSISAPACVQSMTVFTYRENDPWPVKRENQVNTNCEARWKAQILK